MGLQSAVCCRHNYSSAPTVLFYPNQRIFSRVSIPKKSAGFALLRSQTHGFLNLCSTSYMVSGLKKRVKEHLIPSLSKGLVVRASVDNQEGKSNILGQKNAGVEGVEAFRGKAGSVSFFGVTHQLVEEGRLVSAPFNESSGSVLWVVAPVALIVSLVLPQLFFDFAIDGLINNEIISEVVASFTSEIIFYIGLAVYLYVTDKTQRPYLQYSPKRWGLITGLKGYLSSAFFTMGFKVIAPLVAVYVTWPVLGLPALISVAPFLCGCLAQYAFEKLLQKTGSSCWPLVPIIFEVYRLYQLSKAAHFIEKLMFAMRGVPVSPAVLEKNGALVAMIITFQALGMICLWSMLTFLLRLFPSRPVAENY